MAVFKRSLSQIRYITIHHSAVPSDGRFPSLAREAEVFNGWHKDRPWAEAMKTKGEKGYRYISYHYLVNEKGDHLHVQNIEYERYHASDSGRGATSHNRWGIGICMSGYFHPPYNNVPTKAQWEKVATLIYRLEQRVGHKLVIRGHNETSLTPTACPGSIVGNHRTGYLKKIIDRVDWLRRHGEPVVEPPKKCEEKLQEALQKEEVYKTSAQEYVKKIEELEGQLVLLQENLKEEREAAANLGATIASGHHPERFTLVEWLSIWFKDRK